MKTKYEFEEQGLNIAEEQQEIVDRFIEGVTEDVNYTATRENQKGKKGKQRKYFRAPKIYQNRFIFDLHDKGAILEEKKTTDPDEEKQQILCLFFREHN